MTFKKGMYKEKDGFCFQVSYGVERWVLIITKKENADCCDLYECELYFKSKKDATDLLKYYYEDTKRIEEFKK